MIRLPSLPVVVALAVATLAGCSSVEGFLSGDKVDYRSGATKTAPLDVPPDLTQLAREARFRPQTDGTVSASTYAQAASAVPSALPATVAPTSIGDVRVERDGAQRWLVVPLAPEALWPQLQTFWQEHGFALAVDSPQTGVMETEWAENRAKLPQDGLRKLLGRVLDSMYDTGERDKFRTRVERSPRGGSEVHIIHRGMEEVYISPLQDQTRWQPRPIDPQLEAEFLARLMVRLGTPSDAAQLAFANPASGASASADSAAGGARARIVGTGSGSALQIDEGFDRAWRRVGSALDRSGFTVEDRDRTAGLYFVRYVDPAQAGKEEPGFWGKLFGSQGPSGPARYRVALQRDGDARTNVSVQNAQGAPENGDAGQRIVSLLAADLK